MRAISNYSTTLSASITSSQTTIPVTSIRTTDDSPVTISMASFGTAALAYMVIEPSSSKIELIKFTGITDNGDGSGTLTGVTRGLAFSGNTETTVAANGKAHQAGSKIVLSNTHYWYDQLVDRSSTETIAGVKTFSNMPATTAGNPVNDNDLARKRYVDQTATGTTIIAAIAVAGKAGATIADGNLIYFDRSDGKWKLSDADTASTVENVQLGIAQGAGTDGNDITNGVLILGQDDAQSGMSAGTIMYASNTAGGISSTPGTTNVPVGIARTGNVLYFNPYFNRQVTSTVFSALAGTSGTPSLSNKFVTADDVSASGGSGKIIRATATLIATGIHVPIEQLVRNDSLRGSVPFKDATSFTVIAPGTSGRFLRTNGVNSDPTWSIAVVQTTIFAVRAGDAASGAQTIPHGLGATPRLVKITALKTKQVNYPAQSFGSFNGTVHAVIYIVDTAGVGNGNQTNIVQIIDSSGNDQVATAAIDATNITLTWTKQGSPAAANINMLVEANT